MSKNPTVKPPVVPTVSEPQTKAPAPEPKIVLAYTMRAIGWYPSADGTFNAVEFTVDFDKIRDFRVLTSEGPKPRNHVSDILKVALVDGFINPVGGGK